MKDNPGDRKFFVLETIYRWYDDIARSLQAWACRAGCATCCTSLVSLTTLEAAYLWKESPVLQEGRVGAGQEEVSLPPLAMTTNEQASLCISREDFEDDAASFTGLVCPLLADERCVCYEARPLMCRLMLSSTRCDGTGRAEMPSRLLSLTTVCLQLVEDLDQNGWSGYLVHLLPHFKNLAFAEAYGAGTGQIEDVRLRRNRPNPGLLVPPEDRHQIQCWLQDLQGRLGNQ